MASKMHKPVGMNFRRQPIQQLFSRFKTSPWPENVGNSVLPTFFFQMMDIAEAEVLTFHQSYERRVFFGAFVRHFFF